MVWGMIKDLRKAPRSASKRSVRLSLESLEERDCPSGGAAPPTVYPVPIISCFSANPTNLPGSRQVELRGTVWDNHPEQDTITFTGVAAGTTTVDAGGNFDFVTVASGLGTVTAQAIRPSQVTSLLVNSVVTSARPVISSFQVIRGPGGTWTFQGTVSDESPAGIVVQFSGNATVSGLTATCDQNGNFSVTFYAANLCGYVTADCSDVWGLIANPVTDPII